MPTLNWPGKTATKNLRRFSSFTRDDGTTLNYTLVNFKDCCKMTPEVVNQLRINMDNSQHGTMCLSSSTACLGFRSSGRIRSLDLG